MAKTDETPDVTPEATPDAVAEEIPQNFTTETPVTEELAAKKPRPALTVGGHAVGLDNHGDRGRREVGEDVDRHAKRLVAAPQQEQQGADNDEQAVLQGPLNDVCNHLAGPSARGRDRPRHRP